AFSRAASIALTDSAGHPTGVGVANPVVGLSTRGTLRSPQCEGLLGAEFLQAYRVIFDDAHPRVIFESREPTPPPAEYDMSGMFIIADRTDLHRFSVSEVLADGPA